MYWHHNDRIVSQASSTKAIALEGNSEHNRENWLKGATMTAATLTTARAAERTSAANYAKNYEQTIINRIDLWLNLGSLFMIDFAAQASPRNVSLLFSVSSEKCHFSEQCFSKFTLWTFFHISSTGKIVYNVYSFLKEESLGHGFDYRCPDREA